MDSFFGLWKNTLWADIKSDELLDEVRKMQNQLKKLPKKCRDWGVFKRLEIEVKNMSTILPLVHDLHSPAMRERHWKSLIGTFALVLLLMFISCKYYCYHFCKGLTGMAIDRGQGFCLDDLLVLNLHMHVEAVGDIVEVASKELKIENRLLNIEECWRKFFLKFDRHRDTEVFVVFPPDDVLEALEEHSLHLQSMAGETNHQHWNVQIYYHHSNCIYFNRRDGQIRRVFQRAGVLLVECPGRSGNYPEAFTIGATTMGLA